MQQFKVEICKEFLPSSLFGTQLLLRSEEGIGHIVSENCEYATQQVLSSLLQTMNHNSHFLLMHVVSLLSTVKLSAFKSH